MKNLYISCIAALALFCSISLFAQEGQLFRARVVTADNKPVPGAVVRSLSNPSRPIMTDSTGVFTLMAQDNEVLELTLNNTDRTVVTVEPPEMTIVIGSQTKNVDYGFGIRYSWLESTGSVSSVDFETLNQSNAVNPENALYGRLLGLAVMQNGGGAYGASPSFYVRGRGTYQNSSPIVLLDGVERPLVSLSLEQIESVSVLKDATTLALYGQSGANGIINIKTKRGRFNAPKEVKANYNYGLTFPVKLPQMVDGVGYANAVNEAMRNDGFSNVMYSDWDIKDIGEGNYPYLLPNVNWFDEALRSHGERHVANITFRGGSSNIAYYANLNYSNEQGIYKPVNYNEEYNTQQKRNMLNATTNFDIKITSKTDLLLNMYANIAEARDAGVNQGNLFSFLYLLPATAFPVKAEDGTWGGNSTYIFADLSMNPVAQIASTGYSDSHRRRLGIDGLIKQDLSDLLKGLSADVHLGFDNDAGYLDTKYINNFRYTVSSFMRDPDTHLIPDDNITNTIYGADAMMTLGNSFNNQFRHSFLYGKINYENAWERNVIYGTVGYTQESSIGAQQYSTLLQQSLIGQAHYVYDQKYIVDLAMSYSGTNYLQKGNWFHFYPAISAGWIVSRENFLKSSQAIDLLKLRASFGYAGNGNIEQNLFVQGFTLGYPYYFKDQNQNPTGRADGRMATPDLSPELSRTLNIGIDYSFRGKISGSVDYFDSYRTKILADGNNNTSKVLGVTAPYMCTGIVSNRGVEIGVNYTDKKGDLIYLVGGQFSYARNKIINRNEAFQPFDYMKATGKRVGQPFGLQTDGFFSDWDDINSSNPQAWGDLRPGDIKYKDQNGDHIIDANDVVALAYPTGYPEMYFSLSLSLQWKNIGFNALFQGAANYGAILGTYIGLIDNYTISKYMYDNSWSSERNTPAFYPRLTTQANPNNYRNNDIWVVNNPFIKLRNLEVFYSFPQKLLSKVYISDAKLSLKCSDVFSIDKLKISDPEFIGTNYPLMSAYTLGLSFTF